MRSGPSASPRSIHAGGPGCGTKLDRDGDGVGCE
ncbi:excalibur calcium-binding domain-containing protein [Brachybacterium sp. FME24]